MTAGPLPDLPIGDPSGPGQALFAFRVQKDNRQVPSESSRPTASRSGCPALSASAITPFRQGPHQSRFRRYLQLAGMAPTGIHVLRHTAAKLRRDAGESIEAVSAFLDHSSLAVTTVYLRRLESQEDRAWRGVAEAIGV